MRTTYACWPRWPRRARWRSASPRAAATSDNSSDARQPRRLRQRPQPAAPSTAPARRSRSPSTRSGRARFKDQRHDGQLPGASARAAASRSSPPAPSTSARTDAAMTDEELAAAQKKGDAGAHPDRASARSPSPTTSRASTTGLKLDGATVADIFLGKITKWNDPAIAKLNPGVEAARHGHHGLPPLRRVGHDEGLHRRSSAPTRRRGRAAPASTRRSSGRRARAPRATTASPPASSRPTGAVGYVEQAYALQNNFTSATVKNKAGNFVAPDAGVDLGGRRGPRRPDRPAASARSTRRARRPTRSPRRRSCSSTRTSCKAGHERGRRRRRSRPASTTPSATARTSPRSCSTRRCPTSMQDARRQAKVDGLTCNGSRSPRQLMAAETHIRLDGRAAARRSSGRRAARLPDRALRWVPDRRWRPAILVADRVLLRPADRRGAARRFAEVRRLRLHLHQRLGRRRSDIYGALPLRRRHADHVGDRAASSACRSRSPRRCLRHRAVPAAAASRR